MKTLQIFLAPTLWLCALTASAQQALSVTQPNADLAAVEISGVEFNYRAPQEGGEGKLSVLGMLRNTSGKELDSPVLQVLFHDAQGKLVDALTEQMFALSLPSGQNAVVRVDGAARFAQARYASVQLRVLNADFSPPMRTAMQVAPAAQAQEKSHAWLDDMRAWWPFFLVMLGWGIWGALHVRKNRKITTGMVQTQNQLLERQTQALEALADAVSQGKTVRQVPRP